MKGLSDLLHFVTMNNIDIFLYHILIVLIIVIFRKKLVDHLRKMAQKHLIAIWAVASILFALFIHWHFSILAPNEWFAAKWGAGDILTYVSTVALGLLAVWQNKQIKDEADKSQDRLEKISIDANELSVITKLIDNESQYITLLDNAFTELLDACGHENISIVMMDTFDKTKVSLAIKRINQALLHFVQIFFSGYQLRNYNAMPLLDSCKEIAENASQILTEYLNTKNANPAVLYNSLNHYTQTKAEKEIYICMRRTQLNRILLEKLTLAEIRSFYIRPEEIQNEKNENGVN